MELALQRLVEGGLGAEEGDKGGGELGELGGGVARLEVNREDEDGVVQGAMGE